MQVRRLDIAGYYSALAPTYDASRFGGSYGRALDREERAALVSWLEGTQRVLDLGCGTGRTLDLASCGLDPSPQMLALARGRHAARPLVLGRACALPFPDASFDAVFALHVFMHLPKSGLAAALDEAFRVLRPGGTFVFDVPSQARRRWTGFRPEGWHAGTAFEVEELRALAYAWRFEEVRGLLALPLHRLPEAARPLAATVDGALGRSPMRRFCSYLLVRLERP